MSYGCPAISHAAPAMGHVETIGDAGFVANSTKEYSSLMKKFLDEDMRAKFGERSSERFKKHLSIKVNMQKIIKIFKECYELR